MNSLNDIKQFKKELIREIEQRVDLIVNDNRTFIYSKIKEASDNRQYINKFGGGNFLSTLGIFSALNLLAKVNAILNKASVQKDKSIFRLYQNKRSLSEKEAFAGLYKDTRKFINWGLDSENEAKEFWDKYRNSLSHTAIPKDGVAASSSDQLRGINFDVFILSLKVSNRSIYGLNGLDSNKNLCQAINVELFNEKLLDICDFIIKKIDQCANQSVLGNINVILKN